MKTSSPSMKKQKNILLYFQIHQPARLNKLRFFDISGNAAYFDDEQNRNIIQRIARECYLPANALLLKLIQKHHDIRITFSISGIAIDQLEQYAPEALDSFRKLAATGCVDFLTETYYHSLACLMPGNEFELQVAKHQKKILRHFGVLSKVFRNTELIYSDDTGVRIHNMGFKGVLIDGVDRMLAHQSPHHLYSHPEMAQLKLITRDYRLSDDIAFRFSRQCDTISADDYIQRLKDIPEEEDVITLGMDYETFGEHHQKERGIFAFLENLLTSLARTKQFRFMTSVETVEQIADAGRLSVPGYISWADQERDVSAWLGNEMQRDAFDSMLRMETDVKALLDRDILEQWRAFQTSDHFYYMSTKKGNDGQVHSHFSPYPSPYEAFINYMNVLTDFDLRLKMKKSAAGSKPEGEMIPWGTEYI